ncbi:MAG TPA: branched-chain amino acid ABC transporter ATP-binding protein/permease [Chloroflexota bacterium]
MSPSPRLLAAAAALLVALVAPYISPSDYGIVLMNMALIYAIVVIGLNLIYGFGGVFSLAQAAFWGIGAYTSAILTVDAKLPFLAGFVAAAAVTSLFGLLLGVPTLKLRSHYLTMATLAFGEAVRLVFMNFDRLTHGAEGIRAIPPASIGPLAFTTPYSYYYLNLAVVVAAIVATMRFRSSRLGRALQATRDDEMAAGATGVDVTHARVLAFVLSALLAGIGGSLWAHFSAYISPETFDLFATIKFVAMLLIGGAGTAVGPVVGAVLLTYLPEWLRFLEAWYMAVYGLSIVLMLIFAPRGLVGVAERVAERIAARAGRSSKEESRVLAKPAVPRDDREDVLRSGAVLVAHFTGEESSEPLLRTEKLTMAFGGLVAVDSVSLAVARGEVRGIIGPNGSGKTTLLNLVSGIYRPVSGEIIFGGERITREGPPRRVDGGIARTFQNIRLFPRLSVLENVKVARYCRTHSGIASILAGTPGSSREEREAEKYATAALEFVGLAHRALDLPGDLPYGQQRLLEIARALATEPRLLLLDEPAAGMSLEEKRHLVQLVRAINGEQGIAVIVIEHDMRIISGLCHQVTVLNFGKIIAEGSPDQVRGDAAVIEAYLGRSRRRAGVK